MGWRWWVCGVKGGEGPDLPCFCPSLWRWRENARVRERVLHSRVLGAQQPVLLGHLVGLTRKHRGRGAGLEEESR